MAASSPTSRTRLRLSLVLAALVGCTPSSTGRRFDDAGADAALVDATVPPVDDATIPTDGGMPDTGPDDDGAIPMPDAGMSSIGAPVLAGEPRADHRLPSVTWSGPEGAVAYRARIDDGPWLTRAVNERWLTASMPLVDGPHRFEVQARDAEGRYGASGTFTTMVAPIVREGDTFWRMDRVMATSPHGHVAAISAHNCYEDGLSTRAANLATTLDRVHAAQRAEADLIELDLVEVGGEILVDHDDTGASARARLADVLDDAQLRAGDQILFLEVKETTVSESMARNLLALLAERRADYARAGRHVVIRTFHNLRGHLDLLRTMLDSPEFVLLRPYVRLSVLFSRNTATRALVEQAARAGYDMIEPEYQSRDLVTHVAHAHALGLGVNIWTVPVSMGEVFVANSRDLVDAITVDYPIANSVAVVRERNGLFLVDASAQHDAAATSIPYHRDSGPTERLSVNGTSQPLLRSETADTGDPIYGGRLRFASGAQRQATLYDADLPSGHGVFVAAAVRFSSLAPAAGSTMSVVAKSEVGGWALELHRASAAAAPILRFGVYVGGSYHYATIPTSNLSTSRVHFITGAYDGDGGVRLWVDNSAANVTVPTTSGGVANNDVPIVLGADPQADGSRRFYFDGEIQWAAGQVWGAH